MTSEDREPLVEFEDKQDDDEDDDFDPYKGMKRSSGSRPASSLSGRTVLVLLAVALAVFVLLAIVAVALGATALNKTPSTAASSSGGNSVPTTNSPNQKPPTLVRNSNCGSGMWNRVAYLDMKDTSQECPRAWRGYEGAVRCCGRPVLVRSSCPGVFFPVNGFKYSRVCGRAIGYQQGSPDGFASDDSGEPQETVDGVYVDGVSVTHGNPRSHIWTFAVGLLENGDRVNNLHRCPCDGGRPAPDFVGQNYFCETGNHDATHNLTRFYYEDPLWNGEGCAQSTCCRYHDPPWFNVQLGSSTTDDIEVRICGDQSTGDEDSPIQLLEIYVQQ